MNSFNKYFINYSISFTLNQDQSCKPEICPGISGRMAIYMMFNIILNLKQMINHWLQ